MVNNPVVRLALQVVRASGTGEAGLRAVVLLEIRLPNGRFRTLPFLVDSGSSISTIPVPRARELGLILPGRSVRLQIQSASGMIVQQRRPGRFRARYSALTPEVFDWPCHFVEHDGGTPPISTLGLAGILNDLRLTFDGTYSLEAPYGVLQLEHLFATTPSEPQ